MANRRMFSLDVVESDAFLNMPATTQNLYFHMGMHADDEGFLGSPQRVIRTVGATNDDFQLLCVKGFVIPFQSGVIVISHWNLNNQLRKDRVKSTVYLEEKSQIQRLENGIYRPLTGHDNQLATNCQPNDNQLSTKCPPSIVEYSIVENRVVERESGQQTAPTPKPPKHKHGEYQNVLLTDDELQTLQADFPDWEARIERLSEYIASKGVSYKSHYATIRAWARKDKQEQSVRVTDSHSAIKDYDGEMW